MKKNLVKLSAIIALMLLTTATYAQEFHIGAKAGANLGKIAGVAYKDNFKLGYQIGGFLEFDFTDKWGLQGEVLFNQSNTEIRNSYKQVWDEKFNKNKTLDYVSVPVLLKYNPSEDSTWENGKKLFKDTDFSIVAGLEVKILNPLYVYGRYAWGYSDINKALSEKATLQQIQIGVGVRF